VSGGPPVDDELAAVQARLLELLDAHDDPAEVLAALRADPSLAAFADWFDGWDPRMVEVAAELVKKWGRRDRPGMLEGG